MAGAEDEEDDFPATQPVMSVLLSGVVAYVEVRSGHDNRSKGVKAHMRSLGATIEETLNRNVTHVVFNEGLPSTYKKAKKFKCHLVSVLWIEACKEALAKVSEAGYPPIGQQIYENPDSLKNFKKMKSMQPDSDDDAVEMKTKRRLKRMAQCQRKKRLATVPDASEESGEDGTKKTSPPKVQKQPRNKASKKGTRSKGTQNKPALQEITPDVVNKTAASEALGGTHTAEARTTENVESLFAAHGSKGCSTLPENKAGHSGKSSTKSKKLLDNTPITRREFIEGLNDICLSLPNESDKDKSDVSPWRKGVGPPPVKIRRKNPPANKVSPRRSPRNASDSSDCFLFPAVPARKSPRHVTGIVKISKKAQDQTAQKPSTCTSASVALLRKKMPAPPSSPGDDFLLLSQEPGDMPSIDEMAKMRRGSVRAGDERITLSQVIRSYNAVAQEGPESEASTSSSPKSASLVSDNNLVKERLNSRRAMEDSVVVDVEDDADAACDTEVRYCTSRCSSEAGSTVSSTSTRVLINGNPSSQVGCSSSYLPSSGTVEDDEKVCAAEEPEREPSPIFVIKKSKFRRPLKKQLNAPKQSSEHNGMDKDASSSLGERRPSLNPIDYINKLLLPKFTPVDKTPGNGHMGNVIVEETPELGSNSNSKPEFHCVIPPTPVENQEPVASMNQSLTSSVISWVKKSCRVPLFSSHSKKAMTTSTIQNRNQNPSKEVSSQDSTATIYYSFSKETENAPEETENPLADPTALVRSSPISSKKSNSPLRLNQLSAPSLNGGEKSANENSPNDVNMCLEKQRSPRKSIRKKSETSPAISKRGENLKDQAVQDGLQKGLKSKASSLDKMTKLLKPRAKVVVTVVKNDEGVSNSASRAETDTATSTPVILINKAQEAHFSSGYETSNSIGSNTDTETDKNRTNTSTGASGKRKKITDFLSPIVGPPKKRSDVYDSESPASRDTDRSTDTAISQRRVGRKRVQSVPDKSSKKPKMNNSESDSTSGSRRTRASRVDGNNKLTESRSDLSTDSTKSSGRKSSEEARKRMAVSLTRNYKSNALKVIVCTFLTASEQNGIDVAGTKLGGWKLEEKVTPRTTHVINSGPKRTLNMLKGLSRGCWLVDQQWMLDSGKAGTWLDEEKYELTKFSPGVRLCRMKRQAVGKDYKHNLFAKSGPIYVSPKCDGPPAKDIRELLELCGADLKTSKQDAKIVVGGEPSPKGTVNCVNPRWVLDSITRNKVLPINGSDYQIK
ncbi:serine-rich adhesin for platelets-like [Thrips palmi]|uniref:Serine-rich adhesin for platelets-like n=1 Tax=Thrips palmi TaxID=161013 RepID=A0A6P8YE35_THRPL|nr:serine-rich adhesin for platelets-like [Thrips palmi]